MKLLNRIKHWLKEVLSIRELHNRIKRQEKVIHAHYVKIKDLELTVSNLQGELKLAQKNDNRDPKTGRFVKVH